MQRITTICYTLLFSWILISGSFAQSLDDQLSGMFSEILDLSLAGSPGEHGDHFKPANIAASIAVINSLNNFIGTSVSSFPLSSTVAGLTFDFSSGRPVSTSTSLGPIFSERAQTLGSGLINMGFNFTYINYTKIRGINTNDLRLSFSHQDVGTLGVLGDSPNEFDVINFFMNLNVNASIFAFYFSFGVTDNLDVGVAVPVVNVAIKANPLAVIDSYTFVKNDSANHHFGDDAHNPVLQKRPTAIDDDATGVGDIALRAKYNFLKDKGVDLAALVEYRLATGDATNFLGSGGSRIKLALIASKSFGDFTPHANFAYEIKNSKTQRDRFAAFIGYDQKISESLTLALDFIGEYELGSPIPDQVFPDPVVITRPDGRYTKTVSYTNLHNSSTDNVLNGSLGFKYNPKKSLMIISNVFFPLNEGGLRADFIPTLGVEFSF